VPLKVVGPGEAVNATLQVPEVPLPAAVHVPLYTDVDPPTGVTERLILIGAVFVLV
jgi:hypothetical protein